MALAEKGLISSKPVAKQKAMEAILLYVEMDKADPILEELLPVLSHKLPKIVAATLSAFTAIYHAFGTKTVDPKNVLKALPKAYGHADKNVRAEAQNLTVELYRWLRESMKPLFWNDLKPVQQQDLEKLFEKVKDEPAPKVERLLKSQQAIAESAAAPAEDEAGADGFGEDAEEEAEYEPQMLAVDVMASVPKDLFDRLASTAWKDRKAALDELLAAVNAPAIEDSGFNEIMSALAKCILKDANIMVVTVAANCIESLAKGLHKSMTKYRTIVMSSIMDRLKERKQAVADALGAALDAICSATSLSECLELTVEYTGNKNPQVKLESTKFLLKALKTTKEAPSLPEVKIIADAAIKALADSSGPQRDAAAEILGTMLKIMGERIMNTHFENLTDIQKTKIKEFSETAEVRAKYKTKAAAPPAAKPAAAAPGAATKKPVLGAKKTAPPAARKSTPAEEPAPFQLQPKPTARPASAKPPAGSRLGLKAPSSGLAGKRPGAPSSPQKPMLQATSSYDNQSTPPPKMARALTGRTLAKPPSAMAEPIPAPPPAAPALTTAEFAELEDLRGEVERLRVTNERLRADQNKLTSQVHELQDQNAQLIEDHTRDVLSIKAKETQLVRARSDAESAEQTASQLQRELDRLKREVSRMDRSNAVTHDYNNAATNNDIYQDSTAGMDNNAMDGYPDQSSTSIRPIRKMAGPTTSFPREGKENDDVEAVASKFSRMLSPSTGVSATTGATLFPRPSSRPTASPTRQLKDNAPITDDLPIRNRPQTMYSTPRAGSPASIDAQGDEYVGVSRSTASATNGAPSRLGNGTGRPASMIASRTAPPGGVPVGQESWRRAAEVTQNLKARIEMMKACYGWVEIAKTTD